MTTDEIEKIVGEFVQLGVTKIRLTGGEPLVRQDFKLILQKLSHFPVSLHITTNAYLLDEFLDDLLLANIQCLNISIDSLAVSNFNAITKTTAGERVINNIRLALEKGLKLKLNVVLMKGRNDHEIADFVALTTHFPVEVRFIEFMPFDGNNWEKEKAVTLKEIISVVENNYHQPLIALKKKAHDTAQNYQLNGAKGSFGIISTVSQPFCDSCNRIRLTADGKLKNCLFSAKEVDLLSLVREGKDITSTIRQHIFEKEKARGGMEADHVFEDELQRNKNRSMVAIGG